MRRKTTILAAALFAQATPASALEEFGHLTSPPRALAAFEFREQAFEITAVTRRKRADTVLRRAYIEECRAMAKVIPGYPQPAFVSVDIRLKF